MSSRPLIAPALAVLLAGPACNKSSAPPPAGGSATTDQPAPAPGRVARPALPKPRLPATPPPTLAPEGIDGADRATARGEVRRQRWRERIALYDTNADGQLSPDERAAMGGARAAAIFERFDVDADGALSASEIEGSPLERRIGDFAAADVDRDGLLSGDELGAALAAGALRRSGLDHFGELSRPSGSPDGSHGPHPDR